ncbi:hypothetical protein ABSA28_00187 [Candidatus Hepatincolaceae symbiont of Richtersius coronifer]
MPTLVILYATFTILGLFFVKYLYRFLYNLYSKPLIFNTYSEYIPSEQIVDEDFVLNKEGSYSSIIEIHGFSYHQEANLEAAFSDNIKLKNRALNFHNLKENIHIKFFFKRIRKEEGFLNINYIELTSEAKLSLKHIRSSIVNNLSIYKPKILKTDKLLEFLFFNCNLVTLKAKDSDHEININDLCSYSHLQFDAGISYLKNFETKKYFKAISLHFGGEFENDYFKQLMTSNIECEYIINTKFFTRRSASKSMNEDKKNISASNDETKSPGITGGAFNSSKKKIREVEEVAELLINEDESLAIFDCFIIVFSDNKEGLEEATITIKELMSKMRG